MAAHSPVGIGIVGAGNISDEYLTNLRKFPDICLVIVGDLDIARAEAQARKYGVGEWGTTQDVLTHSDVDIVVNLTIPAAHAEISSAAVVAGKHVWSEKPIAIDRSSARTLLDEAAAAGLRVGVAPDTVLGPGVQTARRAIVRGDIGTPLSAQTVMQSAGPDAWHPSPEFLFAQGAGPLFDMGPYYITALVSLFGSVVRVSAVGSTGRAVRTIKTGDRAGTEFAVGVPTHVSALAQFDNGGVSQSIFSFDSPLTRTGVVEITGTEGTLILPDPNYFAGDVKITRAPSSDGEAEWETVKPVGIEAGRGLGVLDMARAIRGQQPHIATGDLGYHVLDTLMSIDESVASGETVHVGSRVDAILLVPEGRDPYEATL
ncbi:Gfo/Idh/MocA family oxidoreductase [Streptomyces sp. 110]|uniref:Gfo/Idh/MocA family oxidoreductase n=1 Tax=Streptomyces endocoffeicus TaxID=2898945 RepID=A0ABS1PFG6_9ACTN|nr:Gfo/Idh/MocA family oxidoreductase [Streptomyces endocoffeicus]MBL1111126.1 Gfo/Idh/MocA family oxidoreductase [Streptomyces endocoffeicus]